MNLIKQNDILPTIIYQPNEKYKKRRKKEEERKKTRDILWLHKAKFVFIRVRLRMNIIHDLSEQKKKRKKKRFIFHKIVCLLFDSDRYENRR